MLFENLKLTSRDATGSKERSASEVLEKTFVRVFFAEDELYESV